MILVSVPLALSGGLIGIRLAHEWSGGEASFDVISMLGFVILAGLVVNNAILIVHQVGNFRAQGMERREALATRRRGIVGVSAFPRGDEERPKGSCALPAGEEPPTPSVEEALPVGEGRWAALRRAFRGVGQRTHVRSAGKAARRGDRA